MTNDISSNSWNHASVICPNCAKEIDYSDPNLSRFFGCPSCYTFFKKSEVGVEVIDSLQSNFNPHLLLECGDVGVIEDKKFKVVAYLRKYDDKNFLYWDEYILLDIDKETYYTLANVESDWYFVWEAERQDFVKTSTNIYSDDFVVKQDAPYRVYVLDTSYTYNILQAIGEFDYNILEDSNTLFVEEFQSHPHMLLSETKDDETIWYRGVHFAEYEIKAAFSEEVQDRFPKTFLDTYYNKWTSIRNVCLFFTLLTVITHWLLNLDGERILLNDYFTYTQSSGWDDSDVYNGGVINVEDRTALLLIFGTDIVNEWVEIAGTLTETSTGKTYAFSEELESYSGYEGGEHWTEGSSSKDVILSSIPPGTYKLNVFPYAPLGQKVYINISVKDRTPLTSNFLILLLLLLIYPAYMLYRKSNLNSSENSDY